jgi:hypothetical protein
MRVFLSTYASRGDVELGVGFSVQAEALGAVPEECNWPTPLDVVPTVGWR